MSEDAVSCFDFFRFRVGALTSTGSPGSLNINHGFWGHSLLQASHAEPAVWNAVAALGALHRKWEVASCPQAALLALHANDGGDGLADVDSLCVQLAKQADNCYSTAMRLAGSIGDSSNMLVLSIALAVAAVLAGKWRDGQVHIRAGRSLVAHIVHRCKGKPPTELEVKEAVETLSRLGLQWASFSEERAPYPFAEGLHPEWAIAKATPAVTNIRQSLTVLLDINRRLLAQAGLSGSKPKPMDACDRFDHDLCRTVSVNDEGEQILRDFITWSQHTLQVLTRTNSTQPSSATLLLLKLYHTAVHLLLLISRIDYDELSWDGYLGHFERFMTLTALILQAESRKSPFTPSLASLDEPGVIMPLWVTLRRCRHPLLRRRALGLLRIAKRQEGMWVSTCAAAVAERLIAIEEEGGPEVSTPVLIPTFFTTELCTASEHELAQVIASEDRDPQSWLLGEKFEVARTSWETPGVVLVPLNNRVTEVSTFCEPYNPRSMQSHADVTMVFAERDEAGEFKKLVISVSF